MSLQVEEKILEEEAWKAKAKAAAPPKILQRSSSSIKRRSLTKAPALKDLASSFLSVLTLPYFPWSAMNWRQYPAFFPDDLIAGITVGIMQVPQGMAYATLASLPPIYGLYTGAIAGYSYSIFGSSGQLTTGAVVLVSLFLNETFRNLGISTSDKDDYAIWVRCKTAAILSFAVGILLCTFALFRIGSLMKFISPSVLTGFVSGSGAYIFISQSASMLGIKVPKGLDYQFLEFKYLFTHLQTANHYDLAIGITSFVTLVICKRLASMCQPYIRRTSARATATNDKGLFWRMQLLRFTLTLSTLIIIIIATYVSYILKTQHHAKFKIVGHVPAGFSKFEPPMVFNNFGVPFDKIMLGAIPLTFLTYMESVSVARKYALVNRYALDMTQELWALGIGCFIASFFQAYPPGGSFSRTAVKAELGVKTPLANIVTSGFVTIVLLCLTKPLEYVPGSALGAVIMQAVISLMDFGDIYRALRVAPLDFLVMFFTFVVTMFINIEKGLIWGIVASVIVFIYQMSKLEIQSVGQLQCEEDAAAPLRGYGMYPKLRPKSNNYPSVSEQPNIRIIRLNANLFFANISAFRDEFYASLVENDPGQQLRVILVDAQGVHQIDLTSLHAIEEMVEETKKLGLRTIFAGANHRVLAALASYDLLDELGGPEIVSACLEDAFFLIRDELSLTEAAEVDTEAGSEGGHHHEVEVGQEEEGKEVELSSRV